MNIGYGAGPVTLTGPIPTLRMPPLNPAGLLGEALRFYAFATQPASRSAKIQTSIEKPRWQSASPDVLMLEVPGLRLALHDALLRQIGILTNVTTYGEDLRKALVAVKPAIGRFVTNVMTSAEYRVRSQTLNRNRRINAPPLDEVEEKLSRLRSLVSTDWVLADSALRDVLGEAGARGTFDDALFGTSWLPPEFEVTLLRQYEDFLGGTVPASAIGLTERLYRGIGAPVFAPNQRGKHPPLRSTGDNSAFTYHLEVRTAVQDLLRTVSFKASSAPAIFAVFARLDELEKEFFRPLQNEQVRVFAVALGLPWALVLTSTLRAYLGEVVGRIFMLSLPLQAVHWNVESHTAIALWESFTGEALPSVAIPGYYVSPLPEVGVHAGLVPADGVTAAGATPPPAVDFSACTPRLTSWQTWAVRAHWGHNPLSNVVDGARQRPFIRPQEFAAAIEQARSSREPNEPPVPIDMAPLSWTPSEFREQLHPLPTAVRMPCVRVEGRNSDLYFGAYYVWQLHIMAASSMAAAAIDELGLRRPWIGTGNWRECPECAHVSEVERAKLYSPERCDVGTATVLAPNPQMGFPAHEAALPTTEDFRSDARLVVEWNDRLRQWKEWRARSEGNEVEERAKLRQVFPGRARGLALIAGSYLWGGRKLPHLTHKDGSTFDLRFGADCQLWFAPDKFNGKLKKSVFPKFWLHIAERLAEDREYARLEPQFSKLWNNLERAIADLPVDVAKKIGLTFPPSTEALNRLRAQRASLPREQRKDVNSLLKTVQKVRRKALAATDLLLSVRISGRSQKFAPEEKLQVFRGLAGEFVKQKTSSAAVWAINAAAPAKRASVLAAIITDLRGTPHPESSAGRQASAIGSVAILLSGIRSVLHGSPITHVQALAAIGDGLAIDAPTGDEYAQSYAAVKEDIGKVDFSFFPHNHHHHWHVEYRDPGRKDSAGNPPTKPGTEPPERVDASTALTLALARTDKYLKFWFALGIDFDDLLGYLEREASMPSGEPGDGSSASGGGAELARSLEERDALVSKLRDYRENFRRTYLANHEAFVRLIRARRRLHAMFFAFKDAASPALQPTLRNSQAHVSAPLRHLVQLTDDILRRVRTVAAEQALEPWSRQDLQPAGLQAYEEYLYSTGNAEGTGESPTTEEEWDSLEMLEEALQYGESPAD